MTPKPSADNESRKTGSLQGLLKEDSPTSNTLRNDTLNAALLYVRSSKHITNLHWALLHSSELFKFCYHWFAGGRLRQDKAQGLSGVMGWLSRMQEPRLGAVASLLACWWCSYHTPSSWGAAQPAPSSTSHCQFQPHSTDSSLQLGWDTCLWEVAVHQITQNNMG